MVQAWYMDEVSGNQKLPHKQNLVSLDDLKKKTGVSYCKFNAQDYEEELEQLKKERGYSYSDLIEISPSLMPNYEEKIKNFFQEHIHTDEEIRFILGGSGYFDVRDDNDKWIRIECLPGDLIILPAGIYHRFTLDTKDYIKVIRLFAGEPVWTPHNRPADDMKERKKYVELQKKNFVENCA